MECVLWIQLLIDILSQLLQLFTQYPTILDRVITASTVISGPLNFPVHPHELHEKTLSEII